MNSAEYSPPENAALVSWRKTSLLGRLIGLLSPWRSTSYLLSYADVIATVIICLVIIAAPFTNNSLVGVILLAGGGFWGLLTIAEINKNQITSVHLWLLVYWFVSVVATAFSPLKAEALSGLIKFTLYLLFFALVSHTLRKPKCLSWVTTVYLLVSLIVSAYGIRQEFIGVEPLATWTDPNSPLADDTRVYSYLGNPNLLAGYLIPAVAFSLGALIVWQTLSQKILAGFALFINLACVYFTDSRGGWLALVATAIIFLLCFKFWWAENLSPFWRRWLIPITILCFCVLLGIAVLISEPLQIRLISLFQWRGDSSNNFRINVWLAVLQMLRDHTLIGIGPGNEVFNKIYPLYMQTKYTALSAYSIFLEIALETGILGIFSFLAMIVATVIRGLKLISGFKISNNKQAIWVIACLASMAGLATQGLFDTVWYRPQVNTLWWLCVAIIAAIPFSNSSSSAQENYSSESD